jgi:hypothetical protein
MQNSLLQGTVSGLAATLPMTLFMELTHRALPDRERYPLPPRILSQRLTRKAGVEHELDEPEHRGLALASHFAFGAAAGATYGVVESQLRYHLNRPLPVPPVARGVLYGLGVWTASYLGWIPATGLMSPATRHPARRNAIMIAAHVLWGATLGLLFDIQKRR